MVGVLKVWAQSWAEVRSCPVRWDEPLRVPCARARAPEPSPLQKRLRPPGIGGSASGALGRAPSCAWTALASCSLSTTQLSGHRSASGWARSTPRNRCRRSSQSGHGPRTARSSSSGSLNCSRSNISSSVQILSNSASRSSSTHNRSSSRGEEAERGLHARGVGAPLGPAPNAVSGCPSNGRGAPVASIAERGAHPAGRLAPAVRSQVTPRPLGRRISRSVALSGGHAIAGSKSRRVTRHALSHASQPRSHGQRHSSR